MKNGRIYKGSSQTVDLRPGMDLHIADFTPTETIVRKFESANPLLRFHFHLAAGGHWEFRSPYRNDSNDRVTHHDRFSMVFFYPELEGKMHLPADGRQFHVSIRITPSLLKSYLGESVEGFPEHLRDITEGDVDTGFAHDGPLSRAMNLAVRQLLDCPYTGAMKQLYMEAKAIELIAHKLVQVPSPEVLIPDSPRLRPDDADRIRCAGEILARDLENPPRLLDLAHAVGTNHSALNKGFREIYGATAFGFLRRMRLQEAKRLLEEEGMNVTEAALTVGYNSIPSFSKAFSDFFGRPPAMCVKKKD